MHSGYEYRVLLAAGDLGGRFLVSVVFRNVLMPAPWFVRSGWHRRDAILTSESSSHNARPSFVKLSPELRFLRKLASDVAILHRSISHKPHTPGVGASRL